MGQRIFTILLLIGIGLGATILGAKASSVRLPDNQVGYEPDQPIAYSHRLHAGELGIDCFYCHTDAKESRHAGVPAADVCMKCHQFVKATFDKVKAEDDLAAEEERKAVPVVSEELKKLYVAMGLDPITLEPDPKAAPEAIKWKRIHDLPDYVFFSHAAHVSVGVSCQTCHGPVETMERVRQFSTLGMGWCVNCHRDTEAQGVAGKVVDPSIDCAACHY